ncbi:putative ribonuclease H-like domain-containing protein [Tanacetum coccineum]
MEKHPDPPDWYSDDEDDVSEVNTVSPVKTNVIQTVKTQVDKIGVLTRTGLVNPVRPNGKRAVHTVSTARPFSTASPISTARPFALKIAQTGSAICPNLPKMDNVRTKSSYSPNPGVLYYLLITAFRPKNLKQDVKTSRVKNMTTAGTRAVVTTSKGKIDNALKCQGGFWRPKGITMDHGVYKKKDLSYSRSLRKSRDLFTGSCSDPNIEDDSDVFSNEGIFSGAYNAEDMGAEADFNNTDNTIDILVELPYGKKAIGTKWVFRNKRDERSIVVKNKARLVTQGFRKEKCIDYDEVFAPVARIEAIMLFLSFASYMGFPVYQMDAKSAFLYGTIEEEVYVHQPLGFVDLAHPNKVYKVFKALYGIHQAPKAWYETLSSFLLENGFRRGTIDKTLFIMKNKGDIMLVQIYVDDIIFGSTKQSMCTEFEDCMHKRFQMSSIADILKKFDFWSIRIATTPIESNKPLVNDEDGIDVDVHVYRSMIGSLMYLTASRPDIMFAVCACARHQVTPKASHLNVVKRIFRWLSISWLKIDILAMQEADMANSTTKAEYVAAANCCEQNPVAHSRTKHIKIRFHFIRDCYKKRLIEVIKIHTDHNVADLLTKGFDVTRFNFLVMATLKYLDKHNMVAFLKKPNESVGFTKIVDFLKGTSLRYSLTHNPIIYNSLVKQFWQTATIRTLANGIQELVASIDNKEYTITEASVRSKLQLPNATGISNLSDAEIYDGLATLGYVSEGKLTFWEKNFTPQWKFLIHTILHCLSPKSGGWDQFGSSIATTLICLSCNRVYNFSKLIFDGMVHNIESNTKFLMYPRFLQIILDITTDNNGKYLAPTLTKKLFANMKRGYAGEHVALLPAMLAGAADDQGEGSTNLVEPNPTPIDPVPSTSQPPIPSTTKLPQQPSPPRQIDRQETEIPQSQSPTFINVVDEATTTGVGVKTEGATTTTSGLDAGLDSGNIHESPLRSHEAPLHEEKELHHTKNTYGKAVLTLVERVKSLEVALKRKTKKVVVSDSEDEETENQGRKIQDIDDDHLVSLVRESMEEKAADLITPTKISASGEVVSQRARSTDKGKRYKRKTRKIDKEISTGLDVEVEVSPGRVIISSGSAGVNTGSTLVSTPSIVQKIRQEEADLAESMRLQALQDEEAARQVHLDALLAKRISKEQELSKQQEKRKAEVQEAAQHYSEEDWDNIRAKLEANAELVKDVLGENVTSDDFAKIMVEMINQKKKYYDEQKAKARRKLKDEFEKLMKSIERFVPMETEERVMEESVTEPVIVKEEDIEKPIKKAGKRKKQKARKGIHVDKTAHDETKEEMEAFMKDKVTGASSESEIGIDAIPTATKPPSIVDWKIIPQSGQKAVYQIIRRDGSDKIYISFGAILKDFSRDDLTELYRLVIKKYGANRPEEMYDRRYYPSCAVHCLTLEASTIDMLADRKYPLSKDACKLMLKMKLLDGTMDEVCYQLLKIIEKQDGLRL